MKRTVKAERITRVPLLTANLVSGKNVARVAVKKISLGPSQRTGLHHHPCPVVGLITKGSIHFQVEGESPRNLGEGDAFYEPSEKTVLHFDNASSTQTADFVAFYLLGK